MKVILTQDVKSLGKKGDVVNVKDGYAKNNLIPHKLAVAATKGQLKKRKNVEQNQKEKEARELSLAQETKKTLESTPLTIKHKAGDSGKLYGSITSKDIVENIKKRTDISIDKHYVKLSDAIKEVGSYTADIKLHSSVSATVKIFVENS